MAMDTKRLAETVRAARERKGWSVRDLARAAGVGSTTVSQIEAGERAPRVDSLAAIADALMTTVGELLGEKRR